MFQSNFLCSWHPLPLKSAVKGKCISWSHVSEERNLALEALEPEIINSDRLCKGKMYNGHHRIFKGGPPPPSQIYGRRRMASHIWDGGAPTHTLANLGQEEKGIAYLGASPRAPAFEKTLWFFLIPFGWLKFVMSFGHAGRGGLNLWCHLLAP